MGEKVEKKGGSPGPRWKNRLPSFTNGAPGSRKKREPLGQHFGNKGQYELGTGEISYSYHDREGEREKKRAGLWAISPIGARQEERDNQTMLRQVGAKKK